jgi:hypothetical protein
MGQIAVRTIFNIFRAGEFEITAAFTAQKIKRAVAEQAVKIIIVRRFVAGEIFTFTIAEKIKVVLHN